MLISTKGRYALRILVDIAEDPREGYIPLKEVAARQDVSEKYLESILKILVRNGVLKGLRGKGGGYKLSISPQECSVETILRLDSASDGRFHGSGGLPGGRPSPLPPGGGLPDPAPVEGAGQGDHGLPEGDHPGGPDEDAGQAVKLQTQKRTAQEGPSASLFLFRVF